MRQTPQERLKRKAVQDALKILKRNAGLFATAQIEMMRGIDSLTPAVSTLPKPQSQERMAYALKGLDVRAEAHLKLIFGLEQQEAFAGLVQFLFVDLAWSEFTGIPLAAIIITGHPQMEPIHLRARYWLQRSFERLASLSEDPKGNQIERLETQPSLANRLDEAVAQMDITHDELAHRIGISKGTYYAVKGERGKRSTRLKVEQYLNKLKEPGLI